MPSATPRNVRILDVTSSSINVQWGTVECIERNGEVTGYSVRYGEQGTPIGNRVIRTTADTDYILSELSSAIVYTVEVAAINSAGRGAYSDAIAQLTLSMLLDN